MRCGKCGAELDDDAVFCYKCGEFVMRGADPDEESLDVSEGNGRRKRNRSDFWLFFRIAARIVIVLAGIIAVIAGYRIASKPSERDGMYRPDAGAWKVIELHESLIP
ncbi:MAG: zinc-ribbon domain-containing protein [Candidatus Ornithomonoglobus sp.]